jgi:hypothetical protein
MNIKESKLLREWVRTILLESDRGGIGAQKAVAVKLSELRPEIEFMSNQKGQQSADVTASVNGSEIARIEVKSVKGLSGLTTVYDKTVTGTGATRFDELALALAKAAKVDINSGVSAVGALISGLGGEMGKIREVRPALQKNLNDPAYNGYSHKLIRRDGKNLHVFAPEPGDENLTDGKGGQLHVLKRDAAGGVKAFNTVLRTDEGLTTTSSPRWWASSGKIPTKGGISSEPGPKAAALQNMLKHFLEDQDDYFMLVDGQTIYPFIVGNDPLDLASLGVKKLSVSDFEKAGLSTYGLAGPEKVRLALKAKFSPTIRL